MFLEDRPLLLATVLYVRARDGRAVQLGLPFVDGNGSSLDL